MPFSGLLSCAGNERESEKRKGKKRSFPFMGERNSRWRKKYYFPIRRRRLGIPTLCTHSGEHCSCQKKIRSFAASVHGFPKNWRRFFSLFENAGKARFVLSFLFTAFSHASEGEEEEEEEEGKGGRLYIFYGMAERAMVSRRKGGLGEGGFIYFFGIYGVFFRSGKPGHGLLRSIFFCEWPAAVRSLHSLASG